MAETLAASQPLVFLTNDSTKFLKITRKWVAWRILSNEHHTYRAILLGFPGLGSHQNRIVALAAIVEIGVATKVGKRVEASQVVWDS